MSKLMESGISQFTPLSGETRKLRAQPTDEARSKARRVHDLLLAEYGAPAGRQRNDAVSELILTVLSQNTSDVNSGRAFRRLKDTFKEWDAILPASEASIAEAIKSAGLSNIKARRIVTMLNSIVERHGSLNLDFLRDLSVSEAKSWLLSLGGVGPKTAACVLLFSLGMPALPVDTHVFRVSRRIGLVDERMSVERAHEYLEALIEPEEVYAFHLNMIAHGRRICKAQRPRCTECVLYPVCDNPVSLPRYHDGA